MKSNKKIANLILAFAATLATVGSVAKVDPAVDVKHEVFGPSSVEAGSLVLLNVQGTDVQWEVFPSVPIETYGEQNAFLATSFKDAGDYLVVCAFTDTDGKVRIEKQLITAGNVTPAPDLPSVVEEDDEDIPVWEPTPDPLANTKYPDVKPKVQEVATNSNLAAETARQIGANFLEVRDRIDAGVYKNPSEVLRDTASLNRPLIKVGAVTTQIQVIVSRKRFSKEVESLEDYADLWTQIGEGLVEYASW